MKYSVLGTAIIFATLGASSAFADGHAKELPPLVMQPNAERVTFEHVDALNACDWNRLMAQYPEEVLIILPNGVWVEGRSAIGDVFAGFCTPREEGGFIGATFIAEKVKTVGDTVNVSWRVEAEWLEEPYKGADAYVTRDGLMYVQVTTFDPADMKFKSE
ncbi:MAG: nuclear transport factor 2 family protein [Paracoccaceae bacterium]